MLSIPNFLTWLKPQFLIFALVPLTLSSFDKPLSAHPNADSLLSQSSVGAREGINQQQARAVIQAYANGDYERVRAMLIPGLQAEWPADKLKADWETNFIENLDIGNVDRILETKVIETLVGDIIYVCAQFERYQPSCSVSIANFVVTFNTDNQIAGIDFPKLESIETIAEKFVTALGDGDFAAARGYLAPNLKEQQLPQQVQDTWEGQENLWGEFQEIVSITNRPGPSNGEKTVLDISMAFRNGSEEMIIIFDRERRIVGYNFFQ